MGSIGGSSMALDMSLARLGSSRGCGQVFVGAYGVPVGVYEPHIYA